MSWYIKIGLGQIWPLKIRCLKEHRYEVSSQVHLYLLSFVDLQPACKRPEYDEFDYRACLAAVPSCRGFA